MSVIMNARGTSVPFFSIGNRGITVYQGSADPALTYTVKNGDLWVDTSTSFVKMRKAGAWGSSSPAGVTSVDIASPSEGIHFSGGPITTSGSFGVALANDLAAVEGLTTTGIVRRTATDTWTAGTLVDLNAEVQGNLAVNHLNSGVGATATTFWCGDNTWKTPSTGVTSVGVSGANGIGVSGSPITSSGTITLSLGAITPTSLALTSLNPNRVLYLNGSQVASVSAGLTYDGSTLGVGATNTAASILAVGSNGTNPLTGTLQQGVSSVLQATSAATAGSIGNVSSVSTVAGVFTMPFAMAYRAQTVGKGSGATISYAIGYYADPQSQGTNNASFADNRAFSGNWFINQADTTPTQLNGQIGLGGTTVSNAIVNVGASNPLTTGAQIGVATNMTLPATTTTGMTGFSNSVTTASSAFTLPYAVGYTANSPTIGVGSTITNTVGYYAPVSTSGVNNSAFSDNRTSTGNWFINQAGSAPSTFGGPVTFAGSQTVSGGTANSIQYLNGSKASSTTATFAFNGTNFAVGTSTLSAALVTLVGGVTDSGGESSIRISSSAPSTIPATIGTGSSSATLQLFGGASALAGSARGGQIDLLGGGAGGVILFRTGVGTGGTSQPEQMRLDALGNLGVGVVPSAWASGNTAVQITGSSHLAGVSALTTGYNYYQASSNPLYYGTGLATQYVQVGGNHQWNTAPSGSAGGIISFTERMRLDASGNLGVGTTNTNGQITIQTNNKPGVYVAGNTTSGSVMNDLTVIRTGTEVATFGQGASAGFVNSTASTGAALQQYSNNLQFFNFNGGSWNEKMRVLSTGQLSVIGAGSPWRNNAGAVQIGTLGANHVLQNGSYCMSFGVYEGTSNVFNYSTTGDVPAVFVTSNGAHTWYNAPSGTVGGAVTLTNRMTLDNGGGLLIGTTSNPNTRHVVIGGRAVEEFVLKSTAASGGIGQCTYYMGNNASDSIGFMSYEHSSDTLQFGVNGAEKMRIDSNGNVLVGQTTSGAVNGNATQLSVGTTLIQHINGTASGADYVVFNYNAAKIGSITQNGTTGVLYNVTSDVRLKENIVDAPSQSVNIDSIQVRQFNFKTEPERTQLGFIAQELHLVVPDAVNTGSVGDDISDTWGVDFSKLVPLLVKEVQELRKRVASLESQLTASPQQ